MIDSLDKIINIKYKQYAIISELYFRKSLIKNDFKNVDDLIDYCSSKSTGYNYYITFGFNRIEAKNIFRMAIEDSDGNYICIVNYTFECKDGFIFKCSSSDEDDINNYLNSSIKKANRINLISEILK